MREVSYGDLHSSADLYGVAVQAFREARQMAENVVATNENDDLHAEREVRLAAKARRRDMRAKARGFDEMLLRMERAIQSNESGEAIVGKMLFAMESHLEAVREEDDVKATITLNGFGSLIDDAHVWLSKRGWE